MSSHATLAISATNDTAAALTKAISTRSIWKRLVIIAHPRWAPVVPATSAAPSNERWSRRAAPSSAGLLVLDRGESLSPLAQLFGFLGKAIFEGLRLFETAATLHDTISCIRVPDRRALQFRS